MVTDEVLIAVASLALATLKGALHYDAADMDINSH
jgi:hypothetical protein